MKLYQTTKNRRTIVVCSARQNTAVPSALGDGLVGYSSRVGELGRTGKYNEPSQRFVQCTQIPALVVAQRKGCWNVKLPQGDDPKGRVVKWWSTALPVRATTQRPSVSNRYFLFQPKSRVLIPGIFSIPDLLHLANMGAACMFGRTTWEVPSTLSRLG